MRGIGYTKLMIGVLVAALLLGLGAVRPLVAARNLSGWLTLDLRPAPQGQADLNGEYSGQVALEGVFTGVYSDPIEPQPVELANIDLSLVLEQSGTEVSGYVSLDRTLVFTQEHIVDGQAVGPLVSGTFDGTKLQLQSEEFSWVVSPGRTLIDRRVLPKRAAARQFRLVSTEVQSAGVKLAGEYRETISGLVPEPVTVVGTFSLQRPEFAESGPTLFAYFSASPSSGAPPLTVTFTDKSGGYPDPPEAWAWTFGDGDTSTQQHPSHTYGALGHYTVTLTVSNSFGSDSYAVPDCVIVTEEGQEEHYLPLILKGSQ